MIQFNKMRFAIFLDAKKKINKNEEQRSKRIKEEEMRRKHEFSMLAYW